MPPFRCRTEACGARWTPGDCSEAWSGAGQANSKQGRACCIISVQLHAHAQTRKGAAGGLVCSCRVRSYSSPKGSEESKGKHSSWGCHCRQGSPCRLTPRL